MVIRLQTMIIQSQTINAMLDVINQRILAELKKNGRIGWGTLACRVGISRQSLRKRIERLEYKKYITGYTVITSSKQAHHNLDKDTLIQAFLKIKFGVDNDCFKLSRAILSYRNIISAWAITGDWDMILLVQDDRMEKISLLREMIILTGGIDKIETDVILNDLYSNVDN